MLLKVGSFHKSPQIGLLSLSDLPRLKSVTTTLISVVVHICIIIGFIWIALFPKSGEDSCIFSLSLNVHERIPKWMSHVFHENCTHSENKDRRGNRKST